MADSLKLTAISSTPQTRHLSYLLELFIKNATLGA